MPLDQRRVQGAIDARERMQHAQSEALQARDAFHEAVGDLYEAGASLREIAEALELSHQRIHQIMERGHPSMWARFTRRSRPPQPHPYTQCSFCGRVKDELTKLIAGPGICICNRCVELGGRVVASGAQQTDERVTFAMHEAGMRARCNFCGKESRRVKRMAISSGGSICDECLDLCQEVLSEDRR